jgi:hypothetical protein
MEKLNSDKVMEALRCKGVEVTAEQAGAILKLLRKLADITVSNHLGKPPQAKQGQHTQ